MSVIVESSAAPEPLPARATTDLRRTAMSMRALAERTEYLHVLSGRLRMRIAGIHRAPEHAAELESSLGSLTGVLSARANPVTGSLLVHFDAQHVSAEEIGGHLLSAGFLERRTSARSALVPGVCMQCGASESGMLGHAREATSYGQRVARSLTEMVVSNLLELLFKRALLALL
jgi:Heavy metal associated domain 2